MSIKTKIKVVPPSTQEAKQKYPLLRQLSEAVRSPPLAPLVVLFTSEGRGIALSGVPDDRIGVEEDWAYPANPNWIPTKIVLTSKE